MPARLAAIERALKHFGVQVEKPKKGSHWKAVHPDGRTYPIPAHNGPKSEISDIYIRGLCRALGLDEIAFREVL